MTNSSSSKEITLHRFIIEAQYNNTYNVLSLNQVLLSSSILLQCTFEVGENVEGKQCRQGESYISLIISHRFGSRLPFSQHRKRNMIDHIAQYNLVMLIIYIRPNQNHSLLLSAKISFDQTQQ